MSQIPLKVKVFGGCHIIGFKVGSENSFINVFNENLHKNYLDSEIKTYPYFNYKRGRDVSAILSNSQTDLLIIQCHYIFNPNLFKRFRKFKKTLFGKKKNNHPVDLKKLNYNDYREANVEATFNTNLKFKIKQYFNHLLHSLLFYKVVDDNKSLKYIDHFFKEISKTGVKSVIILGPFPCTNRVVNKYRLAGNELVEKKCNEYGYSFIDVYSIIKNKYNDRICTIDDVHFSKEAHYHLAQYLTNFYLQSISVNKSINMRVPVAS